MPRWKLKLLRAATSDPHRFIKVWFCCYGLGNLGFMLSSLAARWPRSPPETLISLYDHLRVLRSLRSAQSRSIVCNGSSTINGLKASLITTTKLPPAPLLCYIKILSIGFRIRVIGLVSLIVELFLRRWRSSDF